MTDDQQRPATRIGAIEAAHRLGVKVETLYAYVSRGYLASQHAPGRPSTFDLAQVEALRGAGRRQTQQRARPFRFPSVTTRLTSVGDGELAYRGHDASRLARTHTFEQVASLLWAGRLDQSPPIRASVAMRRVTSELLVAAPEVVDQTSRIRLAVTAAAAADPRRLDLRPKAVARAGSSALACMLLAADSAAGGRSGRPAVHQSPITDDEPQSVTDRLWLAISPSDASAALRPCLQSALILLADHGLAASTVAARAAASARAHPYAVISAGLACLEGPFHGAADAAAHRMLVHAHHRRHGLRLADVIAEHRRPDGTIPGLAEKPADVRATTLLDVLRESDAANSVLATIADLHEMIDPDQEFAPTVELALAALTAAAGMTEGSAYMITSVARTVGWVAHAIEEYDEPPLRWRAREIYTGPSTPIGDHDGLPGHPSDS